MVLPIVLALLASGTACGQRSAPLSYAFTSPEDLARAVLARLAQNDREGLRQLALSADEFEARVWPRLSASRPERNTPLSFVWARLRTQSDLSLARTMAERGGTSYVLHAVRFEGETTDYGAFRVSRESVLDVSAGNGALETIRVFGSMLTTADGQHKVFSYVVD